MNYQEFIEDKIVHAPVRGFKIDPNKLHPSLFPHQRDTILWAAEGGCRAVFKSFGLGKTRDQLELMRHAVPDDIEFGDFGLIVCPLGVRHEFKTEAAALGMQLEYVKSNSDIDNRTCRFLITNYERVRDGQIDPTQYQSLKFVTLDEAAVLRSYGSKTYQEFLPLFSQVPYRFVFTATPSPNKFKELIHYAGFLGIMDTGQALTRFFKRDSTQANNLTLHPHKEREFWLWMSTWALFMTAPSDLGYSDEGYKLPDYTVNYDLVHLTTAEFMIDERDKQVKMFRDMAIDLKAASKEKRESIDARVDRIGELMSEFEGEQFIVWCDLNNEQLAIERMMKHLGISFVSLTGSEPIEAREEKIERWKRGEVLGFISKPEMYGAGLNMQQCHNMIFAGIDHKFAKFIQAIHRIIRFGQVHEGRVWVLYTEAEDQILKDLLQKWERHKELVNVMTGIIKEFGLSHTNTTTLKRSIGADRIETKGSRYTLVNNDCVKECEGLQDSRFGMVLTSIPFSNHYEYTPSYNDFGHTNNDDHFFAQMDYLTPQLLRILKPGRVAAIHVKDRILFGNVTGTGMPTVNPFHAKTIFHFQKHGFAFIGMITIETDVVRENNQTYRLGWTEQCKDGSKMGVGSPEYLLLFRKLPSDTSRAYADEPVTKSKADYTRGRWQIDARAKWNSSGDRYLTMDELASSDIKTVADYYHDLLKDNVYDFRYHVSLANALDERGKLPATFESLKVPARSGEVWDDVVRMHTLNSQQSQSREQNHICPLQFDIVDRAIERWSNPGDEILDPFNGIGTVALRSLKLGRRGYGIELNPTYYSCAVRYCGDEEYMQNVPTLFQDLNM